MVLVTFKANAFGSVGVCDEACRLNGKYEISIGSLCGWYDHSPRTCLSLFHHVMLDAVVTENSI